MEKRRVRVLAASFTAAAFAVSVGFGVQGYARAEDYRRQLDNGYRQAFTELTTAAGELDAALEKVTYATTPALFATLCAQAYATAQAAQTALGELPYGIFTGHLLFITNDPVRPMRRLRVVAVIEE